MTHLTDPTQSPYRPKFQQQGPDSNCMIDGHALGWDSCTAYSAAMALDSTTLGHYRPTGCQIRALTGDVTGGLTLRQVTDAIQSRYGIYVPIYTGANVITPEKLAAFIRAGRKVIIQGNADAMIGTPQQSTAGPVNHAVMVNSVWGGTTVGHPQYADVFDPAADGRQRSYHVDQGPSTWPWSLVLKFCANLRPNGPGTPRLGPGKVYAAVFPDSEPHVKLYAGARRSTPFPDRTKADKPTVWVHAVPRVGDTHRLYKVEKDRLLVGHQYVTGDSAWGSTTWLGNDDGTEWVPVGALRHVGGAT